MQAKAPSTQRRAHRELLPRNVHQSPFITDFNFFLHLRQGSNHEDSAAPFRVQGTGPSFVLLPPRPAVAPRELRFPNRCHRSHFSLNGTHCAQVSNSKENHDFITQLCVSPSSPEQPYLGLSSQSHHKAR